MKENNVVKYTIGYFDHNSVGEKEFKTIASLPSKDALLSMLLSCLQGNIRNLAYGIKAIGDKK
jgi:large subunit ribosomal protein L10